MANILEDGAVIPSNLEVHETSSNFRSKDYFDDYALRQGEVKRVIWPEDDDSRTKRLIEYDVSVQYFRNGTGSTRVYKNAVLANGLMSLADVETFTLRPYTQSGEQKSGQTPIKNGSKVLILCINGQSGYPVIIAGLYDPEDESQKDWDKDKKKYFWQFNGISKEVNDDGELTYTYTGKSKDDGTTDVEDSVAGTYFQLDKDGNAILSDSDGKNALTIDHKNKKVVVDREDFELGNATDKMLLGESHRNAQKQMHSKLQALINTAQNLANQAGIQLNTAGARQLIPVAGAVAAAPSITAAGALFTAMSQVFKQMSDAIQAFEQAAAQKTDFLSDHDRLG